MSSLVPDVTGSMYSTNVLRVTFETTVSQPEKQEAIDLVEGNVIGGVRSLSGGIYYVEVEGDGTLATFRSVADTLNELPQVWRAAPHGLLAIVPN